MKLITSVFTIVLITVLAARFSAAQSASVGFAELPKHEFRGAWIATVTNLDWPNPGPGITTNPDNQKAQLTLLLDRLKSAGINAVFFQIRAESDAFYNSSIEPWSRWLTGSQGLAPNPLWDPLEFAVQEAHRRGMELHAWINPYRAERSVGNYVLDPSHVVRQHPEWLITIGGISILNPGLPDVRQYVTDVIADVVSRYEIDGIHFDDFFYPYPPNHISDQDQSTFENNNPMGISNIDDWRRWNVNTFVEGVASAIASEKPDVKFGISPFGIWKNGVPVGIVGLDAANVIYSDPVEWLNQQWLDYIVPQLYWAFGGGQDYGKLAPWWASVRNGRHLYPGHGLYRSDRNTFGGTLFLSTEVPRQVRFNRDHGGIDGSVFFRARNLTHYASKGFVDSLKTDLYRFPALVPVMDWREMEFPDPPDNVAFQWTGDDEVTISWAPPVPAEGVPTPRRFAIYRVRSAVVPDFPSAIQTPSNLLAITGETSITDNPGIAEDPYYYVVTSVTGNSVESFQSEFVVVEGRAVAVEDAVPLPSFSVSHNYPNPFSSETTVIVDLAVYANLTARVYNGIGQLVANLSDGESLGPGQHLLRWDGTNSGGSPVANGSYFCVVEANGRRVTRPMILLR